MTPSSVPISEVVVETIDGGVQNFKIGTDNGWFVEWRDYSDDDSEKLLLDCEISDSPPEFLTSTRMGWFIDPNPLHNISRRLIMPTVILLIISLFIHAIEPVILESGIIGSTIFGSVAIGPLDYPRLLFYTFPLFLLPLLFRTIANFRDINRQSKINSSPYQDPQFSLNISRDRIEITIGMTDKNITPSRARIQVGIANPERSALLASLGRIEGSQPSPGMSTKLPEKRVSSGDEVGMGVGESTPMQLASKKTVILEPLRIMSTGEWVTSISEGRTSKLPLPSNQWPGSVYSSLIAVHWEIVLEFMELGGNKIKWVAPLIMPQSNVQTNIEIAPVISGRAELSNL